MILSIARESEKKNSCKQVLNHLCKDTQIAIQSLLREQVQKPNKPTIVCSAVQHCKILILDSYYYNLIQFSFSSHINSCTKQDVHYMIHSPAPRSQGARSSYCIE